MAKCSLCGAPAVAEVRYARLRLCREHFLEFVERKVERAVREHHMIRRGEKVVAAISGGKDSATLAGVLARLRERLGFGLVLAHIDLGIGEYSVRSRRASERLADELGLPLLVLSVEELLGDGVPRLAMKARRPACSVCGIVKRYLLNALAIEARADRVATGHNADDIAAYALKAFLTQNLEDLRKQKPATPSIEGLAVSRVKPLYSVYEKESYLYALLRGLPFYHEECPHARLTSLDFHLKEMINKLESRHPGIKLQLVRGLARNADRYPGEDWEPVPCRHCGLISYGGECSFCRLTSRVKGEPLGGKVRGKIRSLIEGSHI
ncbi:MAG: adenine nucleotide alpha hydrolase family protein [Desulfurococcales archaeon]|nr:adenine nucleotide alpha hydrolase family protein [Desulfurococcales archaeon]